MPARIDTCFAFRTPTRYGKYLKEAGFDMLSLANNHAGDFGLPGRTSTQKFSTNKASNTPAATARTIAYLEVKGKKVALIGFGHNNGTPNVNDLDGAQLVTRSQ